MIIGISGKIGSGKDTAGQILQEYTGWEIYKFADALKDCVCRIIGCTREQLEDREFKEISLGPVWGNLTPRTILQKMGTEGGREAIYDDVWVNATFAGLDPDSDNMIITDMRFLNELEAVKSRGGLTIRINRGEGNTGDHPSETALDDANFDYVIDNNGTIEDLTISIVHFIYKNLNGKL